MSDAKKIAEYIDGNKSDILKRAKLKGRLTVYNRDADTEGNISENDLLEFASWQAKHTFKIFLLGPVEELLNAKNPAKWFKLLLIFGEVLFIIGVSLSYLFLLLRNLYLLVRDWFLFESGNYFPLIYFAIEASLVIFLVVVVKCAPVVNKRHIVGKLAGEDSVLLLYTANEQDANKTSKGYRYYFVLSARTLSDITVDNFTAEHTSTGGTEIIGKLLSSLFSNAGCTQFSYHFMSWYLDEQYQQLIKKYIGGVQSSEKRTCLYSHERTYNIDCQIMPGATECCGSLAKCI